MSCSAFRRVLRLGLQPGFLSSWKLFDTVMRSEGRDGRARPEAWTSSPASECWSHIITVDDFDLCGPDQYIRVFPRLLPKDGRVPAALRTHIARCSAVLAWRSMRSGDDGPMRVLCMASRVNLAEMTTFSAREHALWFAGSAPPLPSPDHMADEGGAFALVSAVGAEIDRGALRPFDSVDAACIAFATGIHPAYLWPEALLSHEFYTAAGWLGHLRRRRRADLPNDLAEYFDDLLEVGVDGVPGTRDPELAMLLPRPDVRAEVLRAARARRDGLSTVAVWSDSAPWFPPPAPEPPSAREGAPS